MGRKDSKAKERDWQLVNARFSRREWEAIRLIRNQLESIGKTGRMVTVSAALRYSVRCTARRITKQRIKEK